MIIHFKVPENLFLTSSAFNFNASLVRSIKVFSSPSQLLKTLLLQTFEIKLIIEKKKLFSSSTPHLI